MGNCPICNVQIAFCHKTCEKEICVEKYYKNIEEKIKHATRP